MLYLDEKYLVRISSYLRNFKRKRNHIYNCSCPICGDSKRNKLKARGYFYPNENRNHLLYKCHNCGISVMFQSFLKDNYLSVYDEYILEKYQSKNKYEEVETYDFNPVQFDKFIKTKTAKMVSELSDDHFAKKYIVNRKVPKNKLNKIYFSKDYEKTIEEFFPGRYKDLPKNEPRIVLFFLDKNNNLMGIQGRALLDTKQRYMTAKKSNEVQLVYGLEEHDINKKTYIVEGPIDSLFLPNCLAVATSSLLSIEDRIGTLSNCVYVFDNEKRNSEIIRLMEEVIEAGKDMCIWPDKIKEKDINEMIISGLTSEEIKDIIDQNVYNGFEAEIRLNEWKRC